MAGYTKSDDIPTNSNAYDRTFNGSSSDGFIAKLDSGLKELQACTYLGGSNHWYDTIFALTVDDKGDVYVAGDTRASDFPVLARSHDNSYNCGETDGFIAKLDGNLSTLKASTFLGGSEADFIYCMQMDRAKENIYVARKSTSLDLPATPGAFETIYADDDDGFVAKFDKGLTGLKNLTYLNGQSDGEDEVYAIALDHANSVYVLGDTSSSDFPRTSGVYETEYMYKGSGDVFVTKLSSGLKELLASTLLGESRMTRPLVWLLTLGAGCVLRDGPITHTGVKIT